MLRRFSSLTLIGLVSTAMSSTVLAEDSYLKPHDKIMWIGDSITAQNIYEPYVMRTLKALYPDGDFSEVNLGIGGSTASGRAPAIAQPIEKEKPTLITCMFGVNDTGWGVNDPDQKIANYAAGLQTIADAARKNHADLLYLRETHFSHNIKAQPLEIGLDALLMKLFAAQDKVAATNAAAVVDSYGNYTRELARAWEVDPKYEFTPNFVHPTNYGHAAVAGEILRGLGAGLPLSNGTARGPAHVAEAQAVKLSAVPQSKLIAPDGKLSIRISAENLKDESFAGNVIAVVGDQKFTLPTILAAKATASSVIEISATSLNRRWEIEPIYLAFVAPGVFAAAETPFYYAHPQPTAGKAFEHDQTGWVEWEGRKAPDTTVRNIATSVSSDSVRMEFTWKDSTPVLARNEPYKNRAGEPVVGPLDMTTPFGQPCDAAEAFLDLRDEHSAGRYTSNMDSIPDGTARVALYKIEENGKPVAKLQTSPATLASAFQLTELGNDRYRIEYLGPVPASGVGFNMFVTDASTYAPNKTKGAYLTSVLNVGTDWADFIRLSASSREILCRVGY